MIASVRREKSYFINRGIQRRKIGMKKLLILAGGLILLSLVGCARAFFQSRVLVDESFRDSTFLLDGTKIGFITPNSGNLLEDHWVVLDLLAKTLQEERKETEVVLPAQSLSFLNQAGLAKEYNEAIKDFQITGVLDQEILGKIHEVMGVQYLVYLSLNSFNQYPSTRLSTLGLRLIDSQTATLRLFVRIIQTSQGRIVWEGSAEGIITREDFRARPISLNELGQLACQKLVEDLP
jgi:hypothetical protein